MKFLAWNLRDVFARALAVPFSVKNFATIDGLHRFSRFLLAILALAMGETAVAGTYPASYVFRN